MDRVIYDPAANLLIIEVAGFLTPDDVPTLATAIGGGAQRARAASPAFGVLVLSPDFAVQANDVADLLSNIMRGGMTLTTGRAAVVVGSQLSKLQAERTLAHPRLKVFRSEGDARAWLGH